MWLFFLVVALAGPFFIFLLSRAVKSLRQSQAEPLEELDGASWPAVGLVIPAAGDHPAMESSIRSLLSQSYPGTLIPVMVTATDDEPAAFLAEKLAQDFPSLRHVTAGRAEGCGQKNHNSLAGVRELGDSVDVYAFCDSTHLASPDFLRRLVTPIAKGEDVFTTGYHEVVPYDDDAVTLSYTFCVVVMRLLQAVSRFTEPWGGAMAIRADAFRENGIGEFWATNVVDDCSLTTFLAERKIRVRLCPGALLRTRAEHHRFAVWKAWLDRQILFLKFCVPGQWRLLGVLACVTVLAPFFSLLAVLGLVVVHPSAGMLCVTALFLVLAALASARLRPLVARHVRMTRWLEAYLLTCVLFFAVFLGTVRATGILWHGIWYEVGERGRVVSTKRP